MPFVLVQQTTAAIALIVMDPCFSFVRSFLFSLFSDLNVVCERQNRDWTKNLQGHAYKLDRIDQMQRTKWIASIISGYFYVHKILLKSHELPQKHKGNSFSWKPISNGWWWCIIWTHTQAKLLNLFTRLPSPMNRPNVPNAALLLCKYPIMIHRCVIYLWIAYCTFRCTMTDCLSVAREAWWRRRQMGICTPPDQVED